MSVLTSNIGSDFLSHSTNMSKLTFTIRYNDVRISISSSVPKIADMWDIGL